jgi:hypothetical protein
MPIANPNDSIAFVSGTDAITLAGKAHYAREVRARPNPPPDSTDPVIFGPGSAAEVSVVEKHQKPVRSAAGR